MPRREAGVGSLNHYLAAEKLLPTPVRPRRHRGGGSADGWLASPFQSRLSLQARENGGQILHGRAAVEPRSRLPVGPSSGGQRVSVY